jgi:hypothetical protein
MRPVWWPTRQQATSTSVYYICRRRLVAVAAGRWLVGSGYCRCPWSVGTAPLPALDAKSRWQKSCRGGWDRRPMDACMHARPPALAARRRRVGLQSVCHRTAGSVIHARPQHRRRPRRPTPSALTVRHPASQDDARVPWTARTTTTCLRTDNDERSAALCPCMPTAPSRDRSIERSSRLSVNQST